MIPNHSKLNKNEFFNLSVLINKFELKTEERLYKSHQKNITIKSLLKKEKKILGLVRHFLFHSNRLNDSNTN